MPMDEVSEKSYVLGVSIVSTDSATTQRTGRDFGAVGASLCRCEADKWVLATARQIQNDGNNKTFIPFVRSSAGGFGPAARSFLKFLYMISRDRSRLEIGTGQPQIQVGGMDSAVLAFW
eukprot:CAMPEP_0171602768 /NCGR_PEP_ID=MMETSP0990-20121206/5650_1 /TAXON_ID=483369 /ORGANISM="non described non described, Strain CCMP2098" /LENGTH=118 /DNA_ID=CAMNT_0012165049 /DNA_START=291 /DNA_END=644 /DNA_ORIENTATION=+